MSQETSLEDKTHPLSRASFSGNNPLRLALETRSGAFTTIFKQTLNMEIRINGQSFEFNDDSLVKVGAGGYDLEVIEPGFDESTKKQEAGRFTSKPIILPSRVESRIRRTYLEPCSSVFKDATGKRKLEAYFD